MSRSSIYVNLSNQWQLTVGVNNIVSSGTDFDNLLSNGTVINAPATPTLVATIGDPAPNESNHWGWLYFYLTNVTTGQVQSIQLYIEENHTEFLWGLVGGYDATSTHGNPNPNPGSFAQAQAYAQPTSGIVFYNFNG